MMNNTPDAALRRKGIFLLIMPMILLPILMLLGYSSEPVSAQPSENGNGMNLEMPAPILNDKKESKSEAYGLEKEMEEEKTPWGIPDFLMDKSDSELLGEADRDLDKDQFKFSTVSKFSSSSGGFRQGGRVNSNPEEELIRQLRELEASLNQEAVVEKKAVEMLPASLSTARDSEIRQLQSLMGAMESRPMQPDPELQQLEQLIDKLLVLQNPQLAINQETLPEENIPVAMLESEEVKKSIPTEEVNGFFGLMEKEESMISGQKAFRKTVAASVSKTQEIFPGEAIEIRLDQDLILESGVIPSGTLLYAQTSISGARMQLSVSGILQNNALIPVSLKGYGYDGISGIELSDVKGAAQWLQESGRSAQSMNIMPMGMDWQSQLASSGVQATRSFLQGKTKLKKLEIKSGHPILLIDSSTSKSQNL